jgi:transposase
MEGKTQEGAAAAAGMSVRTARKWEKGALPSETKGSRTWRTRSDPFEGVWAEEVVPLLKADKKGELQAQTILGELMTRHSGRFTTGQLRTLQRRVRDWRAVHGPDKEVYFAQEHPPGREAAVDFTRMGKLEVTVNGVAFAHLLFSLKLSFSGWTWVQVAPGETFESLCRGLQGALWELGGVPEVVRHDNLSAATRELRESHGRQLTQRFGDVLEHYGLRSTRIKPGKSHENGVVEKGHDLVKQALNQALLLRGRRDFASVEAYETFVRDVVEHAINGPAEAKLAAEREHLRPLPPRAVPSFTTHEVKVSRWSLIRIRGRMYSVPSRLVGHSVKVRLHADALEVFYRDQLIETFPRLHGSRLARVDYRHVIWSLVRKPGGFARYKFREELFPSLVFRRAYDALVGFRGERADVEYVRILHLAASTLEGPVERALCELLAAGQPFDYVAVKEIAEPEPVVVPAVRIPSPDLGAYDALLGGAS